MAAATIYYNKIILEENLKINDKKKETKHRAKEKKNHT
jgi:hypothetical protein